MAYLVSVKVLGSIWTKLVEKQILKKITKLINTVRTSVRICHLKHLYSVLFCDLCQYFENIKACSHLVDIRRLKYALDMIYIMAFKVDGFYMMNDVITLFNR